MTGLRGSKAVYKDLKWVKSKKEPKISFSDPKGIFIGYVYMGHQLIGHVQEWIVVMLGLKCTLIHCKGVKWNSIPPLFWSLRWYLASRHSNEPKKFPKTPK